MTRQISSPTPSGAWPTAANTAALNKAPDPGPRTKLPMNAPGPRQGAAMAYIDNGLSPGNALMVPGTTALQGPLGTRPVKRLDLQGESKFGANMLGGTVKAHSGSATVSTVDQSGDHLHQKFVSADLKGPNASYLTNGKHVGTLGTSKGQFVAEAQAFRAQGLAGYSADVKNIQFTGTASVKTETMAGVSGQGMHEFNVPKVDAYLYATGNAKVSAQAAAEGTLAFDPKSGTALVVGRAGASAGAEVKGTVGGMVGRVGGQVSAGIVAGVAARIGGKFGLEKGRINAQADVMAALGVGTHVRTDVTVDLNTHRPPPVARELVNLGLLGATPAMTAIRPISHDEQYAVPSMKHALVNAGLAGAAPGAPGGCAPQTKPLPLKSKSYPFSVKNALANTGLTGAAPGVPLAASPKTDKPPKMSKPEPRTMRQALVGTGLTGAAPGGPMAPGLETDPPQVPKAGKRTLRQGLVNAGFAAAMPGAPVSGPVLHPPEALQAPRGLLKRGLVHAGLMGAVPGQPLAARPIPKHSALGRLFKPHLRDEATRPSQGDASPGMASDYQTP